MYVPGLFGPAVYNDVDDRYLARSSGQGNTRFEFKYAPSLKMLGIIAAHRPATMQYVRFVIQEGKTMSILYAIPKSLYRGVSTVVLLEKLVDGSSLLSTCGMSLSKAPVCSSIR